LGRGARRGFGVLALSILAWQPASAQDLGIEVGRTAPGAKVHTLDGKEADLAQYIGKGPVLIEFWATWCPSCKELEPAFDAVAAKYAGKVKFVVVAVSVNQSPARVKAFVDKYKVPGDIYFDTRGNATEAYDVPATSYVVLIDKAGKVVYTGVGGKQNLEQALKKVL
jgi:thiol-disulfide isomerase/thioredoxin